MNKFWSYLGLSNVDKRESRFLTKTECKNAFLKCFVLVYYLLDSVLYVTSHIGYVLFVKLYESMM